MLIKVKTYSFDNVKIGENVTGRANLRQVGEVVVNTDYIVKIDSKEEIGAEGVLFYVRIDKTAAVGHHDFYTDYAGKKTLLNEL